jgi:hypothetical protein
VRVLAAAAGTLSPAGLTRSQRVSGLVRTTTEITRELAVERNDRTHRNVPCAPARARSRERIAARLQAGSVVAQSTLFCSVSGVVRNRLSRAARIRVIERAARPARACRGDVLRASAGRFPRGSGHSVRVRCALAQLRELIHHRTAHPIASLRLFGDGESRSRAGSRALQLARGRSLRSVCVHPRTRQTAGRAHRRGPRRRPPQLMTTRAAALSPEPGASVAAYGCSSSALKCAQCGVFVRACAPGPKRPSS